LNFVFSISIPKTEFNPRFHAVTSETKYHPLITSQLYNWQLDRGASKEWTILDLPMPVYGKLHVGHFYNKVIKDIINRYKMLKGHKINYSIGNCKKKMFHEIGFNCHGLVIENVALRKEIVLIE